MRRFFLFFTHTHTHTHTHTKPNQTKKRDLNIIAPVITASSLSLFSIKLSQIFLKIRFEYCNKNYITIKYLNESYLHNQGPGVTVQICRGKFETSWGRCAAHPRKTFGANAVGGSRTQDPLHRHVDLNHCTDAID